MVDDPMKPISRTATRWSVRALLAWLVLATLLPGVIGTMVLFANHYGAHRAEFEKDTLQTTRALVQAVDGQLLKLQAVAETLATSSELQSGDFAGFHRRAGALMRGANIGTHVVLSDPTGQQIVNTRLPFGAALPMSPVHAQIVQLVASGQPFVSDLVISKVTNKPTVALYVPVRSGGKVVYALGVGIIPQQINQILVDQKLPDKWAAAAFDSVGSITARTHAGDEFVGQAGVPELLQRMRETSEGSVDGVSSEGIPIFMVFSRSPLTNWSVAIAIPRKLLDKDWPRTASLLAVGIGILFSTGIALAWFVGGRIARSVKALSGPAIAMESGETVRTPEVYFREAEQVATAMAATARNLKQRTDTLEEASRALNWSEARLRGIFDSAADAILTVNEAQNIVMANPAAAKMFRCTVDQLIGAPLERLVPLRDRAGHQQGLLKFGNHGASEDDSDLSLDVLGLRADGEEFPASAAVSHLSLGGQSLITVIVRDITERRVIEEALRASNAMLDAALSSMSDAVFMADATGRLTRFNDAYATFHRFRSREECERALAEYPALIDVFFANGEPAPIEQRTIRRALRGESASAVEYRLHRKDSGDTWVGSYSFAPIRAKDGAIVGAVVSARDVTAIKQTQADLESSQIALHRLISAMDSIQENERRRIARELHDDLQQLLATIKVYAKGIADDWNTRTTHIPKSVATIGELADAANTSLRRIINDLRPQILEHLGLVPALEVLAEQFQQSTGILCAMAAYGEKVEREWVSPAVATCLYRVAQEALNNAAKHAHAGSVQIGLSRAPDGRIVLSVHDDGLGMSPVDLNKLQSFGLLGMKERVSAVNGTLHVDSAPGVGTTVEARVPSADAS